MGIKVTDADFSAVPLLRPHVSAPSRNPPDAQAAVESIMHLLAMLAVALCLVAAFSTRRFERAAASTW
jgi:hypothetical protein